MSTTVITPAAFEPVTLADARLQCRASSADEPFLQLCISGARAKCEGIIQQAIARRTVEEAWDTFPVEEILLSAFPAVSIESVIYTAPNGTATTLAPSAYTLDARGADRWLLPALGTHWPETEASINAVRVRYAVGIAATVADVPADIRTWLLMVITFLYNQREAFDMTGRVSEVPGRFVEGLLDNFRRYGF